MSTVTYSSSPQSALLSVQPLPQRRAAAVLLALAVLLASMGLGIVLGVAPQAQAQTGVAVDVYDDGGVLSESEVQQLQSAPQTIDLPPEVTHLVFLTLGQTDDRFNDEVHAYSVQSHPEWLNPDQTRFADGLLLAVVSMEAREMGLYCGDDVCAVTRMDNNSHLTRAVNAMIEPLQNDRIAAGMLEGVRTVIDVPTSSSDGGGTSLSPMAALGIVVSFIGVVLAGIASIIALVVKSGNKKTAAKAREQYEHVATTYASTAQRLTEIDVRANSLTSPLADASLRQRWEELKKEFLAVDEIMSRNDHLAELRYAPDDDKAARKAFSKAHKDVKRAYDATRRMNRAGEQIDTFFALELGDIEVRRSELLTLRGDMVKARAKAEQADPRTLERLTDLIARVDELGEHLDAKDFMGRYTLLVQEYGAEIDQLQQKAFKDLKKTSVERPSTQLGDHGWHPGYGHSGFMPFYMVQQWDHSARAAREAASASSATTGFSSSSFSGGGGSGRF